MTILSKFRGIVFPWLLLAIRQHGFRHGPVSPHKASHRLMMPQFTTALLGLIKIWRHYLITCSFNINYYSWNSILLTQNALGAYSVNIILLEDDIMSGKSLSCTGDYKQQKVLWRDIMLMIMYIETMYIETNSYNSYCHLRLQNIVDGYREN